MEWWQKAFNTPNNQSNPAETSYAITIWVNKFDDRIKLQQIQQKLVEHLYIQQQTRSCELELKDTGKSVDWERKIEKVPSHYVAQWKETKNERRMPDP